MSPSLSATHVNIIFGKGCLRIAVPPLPQIAFRVIRAPGGTSNKGLSEHVSRDRDSSSPHAADHAKTVRRRYQKGQLLLIGNQWFGRWYEDVLEDGKLRRYRPQVLIGTLPEFPTRRLAQRALDRHLREINGVNYKPRPIATFSQLAAKCESTVIAQLKPSTAVNYRSHLRRHLCPFFGKYLLSEITTELVQQFVSGLKGNPLTIKHIFVTFQVLWRSARDWGYVSTDVTEGVRLPGVVRSERRHFSLEEMSLVIASAEEPYKTCFWLAAETGMRAGELCGLRWQDVDLEQLIVGVAQTAWWGKLQAPKTKQSIRRFSISAELANHLHNRMQEWKPNQHGLVFATRNQTPWQCRKPLRELQALLKKLGLPPGGLHAFRHAQVTLAERLGVPLKTIQGRVGHGSAETTLLYSHAVGEDDRKFSAWLGAKLSPRNGEQNPTSAGKLIKFPKKAG
jgi:integrase